MEKGNLLNGNCFIELNSNPMQNPNEYSNSEFDDNFTGHEKGLSLKDHEVAKDGYQWRKYGQKLTRDNPSPKAYYKCSSAPICSVKKKRSVDDPCLLVVIYEGKHYHHRCSSQSETARVSSPGSISGDYTGPTASLDLRDSIMHSKMQRAIANCDSKEIQEFFVDQIDKNSRFHCSSCFSNIRKDIRRGNTRTMMRNATNSLVGSIANEMIL